MTMPRFYQDYAVRFNKAVDETVKVNVTKDFKSTAIIFGNVGAANADAKAFGYDTLAQTLTLTYADQGWSSGAFSESTSATSGFWGHIA